MRSLRASRGLWAFLTISLVAVGLLGGDPPIDAEAKKIAELIQQLGDDDFDRREEATRSLEKIGEKALSALADAVASTEDLEVRRRARQLITTIMPPASKSKGLGLQLMRVESGSFQMGSPPREIGRRGDEDQHRVRLTRPYYLGTYPVTQAEFEKVMKFSPSWFSAKGGGKDKVRGLATERFPVERVSWYDALEFCNRLSKLDGHEPYYKLDGVKKVGNSIVAAKVTVAGGRGYRLPTEAEWEYACRSGTTTRFHFGDDTRNGLINCKALVVSMGYGSGLKWPDIGRTTRVGQYPPNRWGLYDMHGTVGEWCQDGYDKDYYSVSPLDNPKGPATSRQRVVRGGSWLVTEGSCRSAARGAQAPDDIVYTIGFRIARSP